MAIFSELKIADFPGLCVASLMYYLFLSRIGGATTFASAKVSNADRQDWYTVLSPIKAPLLKEAPPYFEG